VCVEYESQDISINTNNTTTLGCSALCDYDKRWEKNWNGLPIQTQQQKRCGWHIFYIKNNIHVGAIIILVGSHSTAHKNTIINRLRWPEESFLHFGYYAFYCFIPIYILWLQQKYLNYVGTIIKGIRRNLSMAGQWKYLILIYYY